MFMLEAWLERILFEPTSYSQSATWARLARFLRYPYAVLRDVWHGGLTLRAMSLVYTTLLSIVPLLAFAFAVFKGMNVHRELEPLIYEFFKPIGDNAAGLTARVMGFVESISSGVLGSLGLAFLLYSVISMVQKIEESLNFVWHVERPRSFARRVSEYLSLMVVGPIVIVATFGPAGPEKCSGLEVVRYDADSLHDQFGARFTLVDHKVEEHTTPAGRQQQFVYCMCRT